jgi:hypothetical protein
MSRFASKWKEELLDADLDLSSSRWTEEPGGEFTVRSRWALTRCLIAVMFVVPAVALVAIAIQNPYQLNAMIRLLMGLIAVAPLGLGIGIGFLVCEKSFAAKTGTAIQSIRLFHWTTARSSELPESGTVELTSHWDEAPNWEYRVCVNPPSGLGFTVSGDYAKALEFGQQLAASLTYPFQDQSSAKSRG